MWVCKQHFGGTLSQKPVASRAFVFSFHTGPVMVLVGFGQNFLTAGSLKFHRRDWKIVVVKLFVGVWNVRLCSAALGSFAW